MLEEIFDDAIKDLESNLDGILNLVKMQIESLKEIDKKTKKSEKADFLLVKLEEKYKKIEEDMGEYKSLAKKYLEEKKSGYKGFNFLNQD